MNTFWILLALVGAIAPVPHGQPLGQLDSAVAINYCARDITKPLPPIPELTPESAFYNKYISALADIYKVGSDIAATSESAKDCEKIFEDGNDLFEKTLKRELRSVRRNADFDEADDTTLQTIQTEINRLWVADQAARRAYVLLRGRDLSGDEHWAYIRAVAHTVEVDYEALAYMKSVLETVDWVDRWRFGTRISRHAWLLVQHADQDPDFQVMALERMSHHVESNGVRKRDYAYLWDRVAVNQGRLQRYGTQPIWECVEGKLELHPMEEPDAVDQRRATVGMGTAASQLSQMTAEFCGTR
ncbi:MAG: DUF6624 domain-containing protein [Pseudomonadota bacterium]